ncbi:MAG: hypothetical protein ABSG65_19365 [Bryobacteraceae bacterium]
MSLTSVYTAPANLFPPPPLFPAPNVQIYVGSWDAASEGALLDQYLIRGVLNVAYDVDDQPSEPAPIPVTGVDPNRPWQAAVAVHKAQSATHYPQQFAKVGIIDGAGNNDTTLLAAVYMADQLFTFPPQTPYPPLKNQYLRGNLLIHCYAGQSRSVTVAALYIYYKFAVYLKDPNLGGFQEVYLSVQQARGDYSPPPPTPGMQEAAAQITSQYQALFPWPVPALSGMREP